MNSTQTMTADSRSHILKDSKPSYKAVDRSDSNTSTSSTTSAANTSPGGGKTDVDKFVMKLAVIASMSGLLFGYDTVRILLERCLLAFCILSNVSQYHHRSKNQASTRYLISIIFSLTYNNARARINTTQNLSPFL